MKRRNFLKQSAGAALALPLSSFASPLASFGLNESIDRLNALPPAEAAKADVIWDDIARQYQLSEEFINLENGYCNTLPVPVVEDFMMRTRQLNQKITWFMRREMADERAKVKQRVAELLAVPVSEVALTRNTTESMNILIHGIDLKSGDEVILSKQDYGSMVEAFEQKAKRFGTVNRYVKIPLKPKDKNEIIQAYEKAITPKTKMMLVTHIINITGQIMPVKELCELGRKRGIEVLVDGAHAFAQLDFSIPDLNCDYYAASLHKWLGCPIGSGLLYVRQDKIEKIWPLMGDMEKPRNNIEKLEHLGTNPPATWLSVNAAIDFHQRLGAKVKEERLRYLKNYWVEKAKSIQGFTLLTPMGEKQSCGIATFAIEGRKAEEVAEMLWLNGKFFTVAIDNEEVKGVRVTPNVFTSTAQLDQFVEAIKTTIKMAPGSVPLPVQKK